MKNKKRNVWARLMVEFDQEDKPATKEFLKVFGVEIESYENSIEVFLPSSGDKVRSFLIYSFGSTVLPQIDEWLYRDLSEEEAALIEGMTRYLQHNYKE